MTYKGIEFITGKSAKFDADLEKVTMILDKLDSGEELTEVDRMILLDIYAPAYHKDGKIEGSTSFDSSANGCEFCRKMQEAAGKDPSIICGMCYDARQEAYRIAARNRHQLNMLIMSSVLFTVEELAMLAASGINRINSSGDVPNVTYARNMFRIARANGGKLFGFWAKNVHAVQAAITADGKPANVRLVQSSCRVNQPAKLADGFDTVFTVYTDEAAVQAAITAGAGECNGKKCKACGWKCYRQPGRGGWNDGQNIAELLRAGKAAKTAAEKASR